MKLMEFTVMQFTREGRFVRLRCRCHPRKLEQSREDLTFLMGKGERRYRMCSER